MLRYGPRAAERAIFNIVGPITFDVGSVSRANNVEGGNSREARSERQVHSTAQKRRTAVVEGSPARDFSAHSLRSLGRNDRGGGSSAHSVEMTDLGGEGARVRRRCLAPGPSDGPACLASSRETRPNTARVRRSVPPGKRPVKRPACGGACHLQYCWTHDPRRRFYSPGHQC